MQSRNTSICLINPPSSCVEDDRVEPHLGLLYIASTLKKNGFSDVMYFDMTGNTDKHQVREKICQVPFADAYGITAFSTNYDYAKEIIKRIRIINPSAYVIIGGVHATAFPTAVLRESQGDVVVTGFGEDSFLECVKMLEAKKRKYIKGVVHGSLRYAIDSYPFPDRTLAELHTYSRRMYGEPVVSMISSRGCRHHCIHCNSVVMGGGSPKVHYRSADNVFNEMSLLRNDYRFYRFNDDHFTGNPDLIIMLGRIKELDAQFRVFGRLEDMDHERCRALAEAGCVHISVGLESLNADNLKVIGKAKNIGLEKNIAIAKSFGITVRASFMVGLPFDNSDTIEKSFTRAAATGIEEFAVYPLIPYPGTILWKHPERYGYSITERNYGKYVQMGKNGSTCYAMNHKNFSEKDVQGWKTYAEQLLIDKGIRHMRESDIN